MISHSDIDRAVEYADGHNIDPWVVKQILRKAGVELPTKKQQVTVTLDVVVPDGMALYKSNLTIREKNGISVEINMDGENCLLTN